MSVSGDHAAPPTGRSGLLSESTSASSPQRVGSAQGNSKAATSPGVGDDATDVTDPTEVEVDEGVAGDAHVSSAESGPAYMAVHASVSSVATDVGQQAAAKDVDAMLNLRARVRVTILGRFILSFQSSSIHFSHTLSRPHSLTHTHTVSLFHIMIHTATSLH